MISIYSCCERTTTSFEVLIKTNDHYHDQNHDRLSPKDLLNEFGRFKVWAGSLGARIAPSKRISLDYRLKDSRFYRERVAEDLEILDESLRKASRLLQIDIEEPLSEGEQLSDSDSDDHASTTTGNDSELGPSDTQLSTFDRMETLVSAYEPDLVEPTNLELTKKSHLPGAHQDDLETGLPRVYQAIKESIEHLYKISRIIRRPVAVDRLSRASNMVVDHFEDFDRQHVDECFPNASSELKQRLALANMRRRQLLMYNEQHYAKSSVTPEQELPETITGKLSQSQERAVSEEKSNERPLDSIAKSTQASTEATKFIPPGDDHSFEVQSESGTVSSFAPSTGGNDAVEVPPRPRDEHGEEPDQFLCPFCYHLIEVKSGKAWVKHVFRDLQAYVCTFDDCKDPNRLYETRNEWFNHELSCHRREWHCKTPDHPACQDVGTFKRHMERFHASQITEAQIPLLSTICERPSLSGTSICPLCTEGQYDLFDGFEFFRESNRMVDGETFQRLHQRAPLENPKSGFPIQHATDNHRLTQSQHEKIISWIQDSTDDGTNDQPIPSTDRTLSGIASTSNFHIEASNLKHHIGRHLERLALFAIPLARYRAEEGSEATNQNVPRSLSSGRLSQSTQSILDRSRKVETMYKRALERYEKALGLEHTSTLEIVNNLGNVYYEQGMLAEAEVMYKRALEGYKILGPKHTSTIEIVNKLGNTYYKQGRRVEAEEMYKRALEVYAKVFGPEHTSTLEIVNNLGDLYYEQGRLKEAEKMYKRALIGYELALGAEHTSTLEIANNLGSLYQSQGRLEEAEEMYKRALTGYELALGTKHTSTLDTVKNLGSLYRDLGRLEEAEVMYERALEGFEIALGAEHTSTLDTVKNLGSLYRDLGMPKEAEVMYERALEGFEIALGAKHWVTLDTANNLGSLYQSQGRLTEAEIMYERALEGKKKAKLL